MPKVKSTKILSADDDVTQQNTGQNYYIVQKFNNIRKNYLFNPIRFSNAGLICLLISFFFGP